LAIRSHFFELLDENSRPRLAHELAEGDQYSVVLTTGEGCTVTACADCVRVTGFEAECPLLRFVGRKTMCPIALARRSTRLTFAPRWRTQTQSSSWWPAKIVRIHSMSRRRQVDAELAALGRN